MKINPNPQDQDIMVNGVGNKSYRDVNAPVHVEPAVKIQLSQEAFNYYV